MVSSSNNSIDDNSLLVWKSQIGKYDINSEEMDKKCGLLNVKEQEKLFEKNVKREESGISAREAFLDYLHGIVMNGSNEVVVDSEKNANAIKIKKLLGREGVALYKKAIAEENDSEAFRKAVFFKSTQEYQGSKWDKKLVLWVGGPSASGKSFGTKAAVEKISSEVMHTTSSDSNEKNYVVSIDGGIEREVSQMRKMLLQVALSKGYKGIEDLHSHTKLTVKYDIQKVALQNETLNLAIPETFTVGLQRKTMEKIEKKGNIVQAFAEIGASDEKRFQDTVKMMGDSRAWNTKEFDNKNITMNAKDLCESKRYESDNFKWGVIATIIAKKNYLRTAKKPILVSIENDLIYVKKLNDGTWVKCSSNEGLKNSEKIIISNRDFENYNKYLDGNMMHPNLESNTIALLREKQTQARSSQKNATKDDIDAIIELRNDKKNNTIKSLTDWQDFCKKSGLLYPADIAIKREKRELKKDKGAEDFLVNKIKESPTMAKKQLGEAKNISESVAKSITKEIKKTHAEIRQTVKGKIIKQPFSESFQEEEKIQPVSSDKTKNNFIAPRKMLTTAYEKMKALSLAQTKIMSSSSKFTEMVDEPVKHRSSKP